MDLSGITSDIDAPTTLHTLYYYMQLPEHLLASRCWWAKVRSARVFRTTMGPGTDPHRWIIADHAVRVVSRLDPNLCQA